MQAAVASPEVPRGRPQRARSAANMSTESGLNSFGITDSGEDAAGGDEADMEEEVVGGPPLLSLFTSVLNSGRCAAHVSYLSCDIAWRCQTCFITACIKSICCFIVPRTVCNRRDSCNDAGQARTLWMLRRCRPDQAALAACAQHPPSTMHGCPPVTNGRLLGGPLPLQAPHRAPLAHQTHPAAITPNR